jgi:hypothetical protein
MSGSDSCACIRPHRDGESQLMEEKRVLVSLLADANGQRAVQAVAGVRVRAEVDRTPAGGGLQSCDHLAGVRRIDPAVRLATGSRRCVGARNKELAAARGYARCQRRDNETTDHYRRAFGNCALALLLESRGNFVRESQ